MRDPDALMRLRSAGFAPGEAHRALMALAGDRVPTVHRLRAWRAVEVAAALLAEGRPAAEVARALRQRYGFSERTARRRVAEARPKSAPSGRSDADTAPTT